MLASKSQANACRRDSSQHCNWRLLQSRRELYKVSASGHAISADDAAPCRAVDPHGHTHRSIDAAAHACHISCACLQWSPAMQKNSSTVQIVIDMQQVQGPGCPPFMRLSSSMTSTIIAGARSAPNRSTSACRLLPPEPDELLSAWSPFPGGVPDPPAGGPGGGGSLDMTTGPFCAQPLPCTQNTDHPTSALQNRHTGLEQTAEGGSAGWLSSWKNFLTCSMSA